jgi:hypothetical protein
MRLGEKQLQVPPLRFAAVGMTSSIKMKKRSKDEKAAQKMKKLLR